MEFLGADVSADVFDHEKFLAITGDVVSGVRRDGLRAVVALEKLFSLVGREIGIGAHADRHHREPLSVE